MSEKKAHVKEFFERTDVYLTYDHNLRIRRETVVGFIKEAKFQNVLDLPCGTGDISVPLLGRFEHLTLVDIATNMCELAESKVLDIDRKKVTMINSDFMKADLPNEGFDLVISLGILAHVDDPEQFMKFIARKVAKGGSLIIQNTDSSHFYSHLIRGYLGVKRAVGKDKYSMNKLPGKQVEDFFSNNGFTLERQFRYNQSLLGFSHLFSDDQKYRMIRDMFGNEAINKRASMGSDVTYLFRKAR